MSLFNCYKYITWCKCLFNLGGKSEFLKLRMLGFYPYTARSSNLDMLGY